MPGWKSDIGHSLDALILRNVPNVRKAMDEWAYRRDIRLSFIRPGKPVDNAFAESCDGRLRDECLLLLRNVQFQYGVRFIHCQVDHLVH